MPAEAAAAQATETATPAAEPKSGQVVLERGPGGRFQKAKEIRRASFEDRMNKMDAELSKRPAPTVEGDTTAGAADDEEEEIEEGAESSTATSSPTTDKPAEPKPKRETVEVEGKPDFTQERLAFNEWKRKQREAFEAHMRKLAQDHQTKLDSDRKAFDEERGKFSPRVEKAEKLLQLMETADYENLAKEAGYDGWDKFQEHVLGVITDPNYKRTRELERKLAEKEAAEKKEREEREHQELTARERAAAQAEQQRRAQAVAGHKKSLSEAMAKSADRTVAAMADDPAFVNTVFEIQRQNYDPSTNSTVSPEQAIKMALRGGQRTVREELTLLYQRLKKAVGEDEAQAMVQAAAAQAVPAAEAKPKASKTGVVPTTATVEPAATGKYKGPKDPAWRKRFNAAMDEAFEAEETAKSQRRAGRK